MNDQSDTIEQYCSPYYDKYGSYNDGFPCPSDKYCCQNKDGLKYCCSLNNIKNQQFSSPSSTIISKLNNQQKFLKTTPSQQQSSIIGSLPMLITNSTLLISLCAGFLILLTLSMILYFCFCRRCRLKKSDDSSSSSKRNRIISSTASSTPTSSSLTTPIGVNTESSTSGLLIEAHSSNNQSHYYTSRMMSQQEQHQPQYFNSIGAISSGSSNITSSNILLNLNINSANTTQTSLTTNQMNNIVDFDELDEEEANEEDFILYTSNNLEFLKSHSLFNGKSPLNYYPSITTTRSSIKSPFDDPPPCYNSTNETPQMNLLNINNNQPTQNELARFSTFLPTHYVKNEIL